MIIGAITDHDTIAGIPQAIEAARKYGFRLFPGIEITSEVQNREMHILGLGIDHRSPEMRRYSEYVNDAYIARAIEMCERIEGDPEHGWKMDQSVLHKSNGVITRDEISRAVQNRGMSSSDFFTKYLTEGSRYYVKIERIPARETIEVIHAAGGKAVWAHPAFSLRKVRKEYPLGKMAKKFSLIGLDGIEAFYKKHTRIETESVLEVAMELGIFPSFGSDFHRERESVPGQFNTYGQELCLKEAIRRLIE